MHIKYDPNMAYIGRLWISNLLFDYNKFYQLTKTYDLTYLKAWDKSN